jgi:hypothetical protein
MFYPSLAVGGLFDSNVFATNTNPRSDVALRINPVLGLQSLWERHEVNLLAEVRSDFYRENPGLDQTDASLKGRARIDVTHDAAILTAFQTARLNEGVGTLSSPTGAVRPTPYDLIWGDVTYRQEFNRLVGSIGLRADSYDYGSTVAQNGTIIDQSNRDGQIYTAHGRLDYVFSPKLGMFTAVEGNKRDIRGTPATPLGSEGYRTLSGVGFELSHLVFAEIAAGYSSQQFDAPTLPTVAGPAYRAMLTWSPTRMIDVRFKAEQIFTQAAPTDGTGVQADAIQLGVDYEIWRNLVLSVAGTYERDKFIGQARRDNVLSSFTELKYLLNRFSSISLRHRYIDRDSTIPTSSYLKHEIGINVTSQF